MCAGLALLAVASWSFPHEALEWRRPQWLAEPWRLLSAAFVHWTPWHLAANLIGCVVVAAFGVAARVPMQGALAWLLAWPLAHAALALHPGMLRYGGLSGLLHAGVAIAAWYLLAHGVGRRRAIGAAVMVGLLIKLASEEPWGAATVERPGWDFALAPFAHLSGAVVGWLCALLVLRPTFGAKLSARQDKDSR
jgi:rhomboid family GlyGly-CTERM serine protease